MKQFFALLVLASLSLSVTVPCRGSTESKQEKAKIAPTGKTASQFYYVTDVYLPSYAPEVPDPVFKQTQVYLKAVMIYLNVPNRYDIG